MTLTETLQLEEKYLKYDDLRAIDYCEKRWQEEKIPAERWQLINFLEKMMRELVATGIGYPKVLLLRKKEIQRGTFTLEPMSEGKYRPQPLSPDTCSECDGNGFFRKGDMGSLCMSCLGKGRKPSGAGT